jgi:thioredoxin 1
MWLLARSIWNKKGASTMGKIGKIAIVVILAVAVATVVAVKQGGSASSAAPPASRTAVGLPRLVDLGSTTCIPCKMMAPVLDELGREYAGRLRVEFINVNENPEAAKSFGIKLIPTQVFIDASGKELFRHEGFLAKADILAQWKALGVNLAAPASSPTTATAPAVPSGST